MDIVKYFFAPVPVGGTAWSKFHIPTIQHSIYSNRGFLPETKQKKRRKDQGKKNQYSIFFSINSNVPHPIQQKSAYNSQIT